MSQLFLDFMQVAYLTLISMDPYKGYFEIIWPLVVQCHFMYERIFKHLQRKVWIIQNSSFCNSGIYLFSNLVFNYVYYQCSHTTADEKKWLGRKFVTYGDWLSHMICFHHLLFQFICARANYWDDIVRFFERGSTMGWKKFGKSIVYHLSAPFFSVFTWQKIMSL